MIYIIIPVHNRKILTRKCLESLSQQDTNDFTVVLVDDGSSDGTSEMILKEFPETVLLNGDGNLWWAGSINKGIRYALRVCEPTDYILTLNDDLIVPPDYISNFIKVVKSYPDAIIGSVETTINNPEIIKSGGISVNWTTAKVEVINFGRHIAEFPPGYYIRVSRLTGRGTIYPSQVFREVGLFDEENIKHCADTELPVRANFHYGYPLIVSYDTVVFSHKEDKKSINAKSYYTLSDAIEYFFGIRSHFNLKNRYWITRNIAPNAVWFIRVLFLEVFRIIVHYAVRFKLRGEQ